MYATIVDEMNGLIDRNDVRKKLDEVIEEQNAIMNPEEWGNTQSAEEGIAAMMALAEKM